MLLAFSNRTLLLLSGLLFIISFGVYYPSLNSEFLTWDTHLYVIETKMIRSLAWENLWQMLTSLQVANWHPLTWFSYSIDYAIYGLNPWGFHLTNSLWHSANTVLFFLLALKLLKLHNSTISTENRNLWIAALAALWFGIHPQHVESVVWIAERKDVLSLFFSLLTISTYLNYAQTRLRRDYFLSLLCFCLALMSKPMAVTLPVVLLLLDIYPLRRTFWTASPRQESLLKLGIEKIPFFLGSLLDVWLTMLAQHQASAIVSLEKVSIAGRVLNAFDSIILYLSKFLLPIGLSPLYPLDRHIVENPLAFMAVAAVILLSALAIYAWYKRQFAWLICWLFYLVSLLPVLGLIQVGSQAAADRYAYISTLPFYLIVATGFSYGLFHPRWIRRVATGIGVLLITLGLSYATVQQSKVWKNDLGFWGYVLTFAADMPAIWLNVGNAYFRMGEYQKAIEVLQKSPGLRPNQYSAVHYNLAQCYVKIGQLQTALELYQNLIVYDVPLSVSKEVLYYNVGLIYQRQGKFDEARDALEKALSLDPTAEPVRELLKSLPAKTPEKQP
ncbi:MAG: tetratricopeptide repeat protein [Thiotrichaceae bacterium]|nr:tetratricopeptide repeat protein [Thiotrichaceae bacterium]